MGNTVLHVLACGHYTHTNKAKRQSGIWILVFKGRGYSQPVWTA